VRRFLTGLVTFCSLTITVLVLPVYAAPVPEAHPVHTSINELALGSVVDPEGEAVVATDGVVQADGVDEADAAGTSEPATESPATESPATGSPATGSPATGSPATGSPATGSPATGSPATGSPATGSPATGSPSTESPATTAGSGTSPEAPNADVPASAEELPGVPALTVSQEKTDPFSSVGVTWRQDPAVTDVRVRVRVRHDDGDWGSWADLQPDDIEQTATSETAHHDLRGGTAPYWTGAATGLQVAVQGAGGAVPEDVSVALLDPGTSKADAMPTTSATGEAHAGTFMPDIVSRSQWGADESIRTWDPEYAPTIKAATIHHTADSNDYTAAQVPAMLRSIYAYHAQTRGWGDIGYNVIVDKYGRIFEGRYGGLSSTVIGAHAGGFNTGTFGVSMLGDYTTTDPSAVMLDSVAAVIAWKLSMYGVSPYGATQLTSGGGGTAKYAAGTVVTLPTIFAHRDVGNTTCPGQAAYNRMDEIRARVAARMTPPGGSPIGNLEAMGLDGNRLVLGGWVFDPDYPPGGIAVAVDVNGTRAGALVADQPRPDVAAAYPQAGLYHGFWGTVPLSVGNNRVCVYFLNASSSGRDVWVTCRTVVVTTPPPVSQLGDDPIGTLEDAQLSGTGIRLTGWTLDPTVPTSPIAVHVYLDGAYALQFPADGTRTDIGTSHPGTGKAHGFSSVVPVAAPGRHEICAYGINEGVGTVNTPLGCRPVDVPATAWDPRGWLDTVTASGAAVAVTGWGMDPDSPTSPSLVHVFIDGAYRTTLTADRVRDDVAAAFTGTGNRHGYSGQVLVGGGLHSVCTFVINSGIGTQNTLVGCRWVELPGSASAPIGNPDTITPTPTGLMVAGWALDPDIPGAAIDVHVYVDGRGAGRAVANELRPDVGGALPEAGPQHGFSLTVPLASGQHQVCLYGINVGAGGTNPLLACRDATV
jgi:hypothetical protein